MKKLSFIIFTAFCIIIMFNTKAQQVEEYLYFSQLPQASMFNPALNSSHGLYINVPVLNGLSFSASTTGFAWNDLFKDVLNGSDSTHVDFDGFLSKLDNTNHINLGFKGNLLGFGYSKGKNHFSFNWVFGLETRLTFTKSLFELFSYGTDYLTSNESVFDDKFWELSSWMAPTFSYARDIDSNLTVGVSGKVYMGLANIHTKKAKLDWTIYEDHAAVKSDVEILNSNAFVDWAVKGLFNDGDISIKEASVGDMLSNSMKNLGLGFDLGASYKINDKMQVSGAIMDIGFIHWKSYSSNFHSKHPNETYAMGKVPDNYEDVADYFEAIGDSLETAMDMENVSADAYTTMVPTKIYTGFSYNVIENLYANVLYKSRIMNSKFDNTFYLSAAYRLAGLQFSLGNTFSYTAFNPSLLISYKDWAYIGANMSTFGGWKGTKSASFCMGINIKI